MARRGNSVIGIDLGKHNFKGVLLQRKSDERFVLTSYASREVPEEIKSTDELAQQIKLLVKDLGSSTKGLRARGLRSGFTAAHHRATAYPG